MTEPTIPASPDPAAGEAPAKPPANPALPAPVVPITATAAAEADGAGTPPGTAQPTAVPPEMESEEWPPDRRLVWGLFAVLLWLLLFAVGTLIDSEASRVNLGWKPPSEQKAVASVPPDEVLKLHEQLNRLEDAVKNLAQPKDPVPPAAKDNAPAEAPPAKTSEPKQSAPPGGVGDFLVAMFSFIPLNIGFLCILAAFIGGCSVNKEEIWQLKFEINALRLDPDQSKSTSLRRRLNYLTEHPGYSTVRGMVVYLILISGLFIVGGDPLGDAGSQVDALTKYMRLAGLFSFFGYLAGYDPTVFTSLLNLGSSRLRPTQPEPSPKP